MKNKRSALSHEDEQEIIAHIRDAKNKKEQVQIEAQLHNISPEIVKDLLREHGWNLRCLNGGNRKKKVGISVGLGEDNPNEAWTPAEAEAAEQEIITPVEGIAATEESAAETQRGECASTDDVLFVGLQILEEAAVFDAIKEKINKLIARRRGLVAELGHLDVLLKKYAFFYEDIYQDMQEEGIEL